MVYKEKDIKREYNDLLVDSFVTTIFIFAFIFLLKQKILLGIIWIFSGLMFMMAFHSNKEDFRVTRFTKKEDFPILLWIAATVVIIGAHLSGIITLSEKTYDIIFPFGVRRLFMENQITNSLIALMIIVVIMILFIIKTEKGKEVERKITGLIGKIR